jgi:dihydroorotase-like cyclic amidohydrolase
MSTDYSPFEGMAIRGGIDAVVAGGRLLVSSGKWVGEGPSGRYIHRRRLKA